MDKYLPRIVDKLIDERLGVMGALLIAGPKWCGKTTSAEQKSRSVLKMQDPDNTAGYLATAQVKPSLLLMGENPRLIDEWQMAPVLWDAVRTAVDNRQEEGLFILTGSTSVDESLIMHSGTGRISRLLMRTMSLYETLESNGKISLMDLFNNADMDIDGIQSDLSIEDLIFAACRGGWPAALNKKDLRASLYIAKSYVENICESDVSTVDGIKKDPKRVRMILNSYSRNISTLATDKTVYKDVVANFSDMSIPTFNSYIDALCRLFVIDDINGWCPSIRSASAIRSGKKREFIDPSIAVASLGLSPEKLMVDLNTFGFIFENLCLRDLKVYSSAMEGETSYYHDRYGLEADCVLHLSDGRYALIEFKLGSIQIEEGAQHLLKLNNLIKKNNADKNLNIMEPCFLAIVTGGQMAYTRPDGVKIIPIGCLKD
ncbi:MAG: DUF4143 domain-containing protein [Anaerovoracaceae bacterium]